MRVRVRAPNSLHLWAMASRRGPAELLFGGLVAIASLGAGASVGALEPSATVALLASLTLGWLLHVAPRGLVVLLVFSVAAIPKAGIRTESLPVPFMLPALCLAIAIAVRQGHRAKPTHAAWFLGVTLVAWVTARVAIIYCGGGAVGNVVAPIFWCAATAVTLLLASCVQLPAKLEARWARACEYGYAMAAVFGLVQLFAGIDRTVVPGITLALGDSYLSKNNGILDQGPEGFSKIPSTYQSGNVWGIVSAFFVIIVASRVLNGRRVKGDLILLPLAGVSVLLSGSRTAVVAGVTVGLALAFRRGRLGRRAVVTIGTMGAFFLAVWAQPGLLLRLSIGSAVGSNAGGRTTMWPEVLSRMSVGDVLFGSLRFGYGTSSNEQAEGWLGVVQQVGVIGVVLFVAVVVLATSGRLREWRLPFLVLGIAMILDSTYFVFPTLLLPAARVFASLLNVLPGSSESGACGTSRIADRDGLIAPRGHETTRCYRPGIGRWRLDLDCPRGYSGAPASWTERGTRASALPGPDVADHR